MINNHWLTIQEHVSGCVVKDMKMITFMNIFSDTYQVFILFF